MATGAADLYRDFRKKGATVPGTNDCLIAHHALMADMTLSLPPFVSQFELEIKPPVGTQQGS